MGEPEFERLCKSLEIKDIDCVLSSETFIVPVNITYYPARPRENILSRLGQILMKEPSKRVMDELMTEGSMLFSNVDITIHFGEPIAIRPWLNDPYIESMLCVKRRIRFEQDISSKQIIRKFSYQIMEQYMSKVYAMTSFNYDHVLACILKHFPYRKDGIDIYEFRLKVYYAVVWLASQEKFNVSDNFMENQIHLLTDDRFHRFEDFFKIAVDTGVIEIRDNMIFKDQTKFITPSNFHTIRIENPLLVMANEVEPVREVELFLKKTAQKSFEEISELVTGQILEKIHQDFLRDYDKFYIKGESKDKEIGKPLFLKSEGKGQSPGILLIHGYMAAPEEMKKFADFLHKRGFTVYVPRLKGHGTAPEDLAESRFEQWIESVEQGFVVLRHSCSEIIVGGFSTGAALALDLAARMENISSVFAVAPPMKLQDMGSFLVPAIDTWNSMIKKIHLDPMAKEFVENHPENPHINYVRNPISGIHQLEKLMEYLEEKLKDVTQPALVVQSRKDPVVDPKGTARLFDSLGSEIKEYYIFDYGRHGILTGHGVERVFSAIENFITQWV